MIGDAVQSGYLTWPKLGLKLVTINLLSELLLRPAMRQVFTILYSYEQYKCTVASLGIDKMKKLVKMMKQVKIIKLVSLRSVSGFPWELKSA